MSKKHVEEHENLERWLVSYADFITLLFAFFTVLYATSKTDQAKLQQMVEAMNEAFDGKKLESIIENIGLSKASGPTNYSVPQTTQISLRPDMAGLLSNNAVQLGRVNQSVSLDLPERILFASGSAEIHPTAFPILGEIAEALGDTEARLEVLGHSNAVPYIASKYEDNLGLATARALSTVRYLSKRGMPIDQMTASGQVCSDVWPDARAVTLRVVVEQPALAGEVMERLHNTSFGPEWN